MAQHERPMLVIFHDRRHRRIRAQIELRGEPFFTVAADAVLHRERTHCHGVLPVEIRLTALRQLPARARSDDHDDDEEECQRFSHSFST